MSNQQQLADPSVYVNDVLIPIVAGTFKSTPAKGEVKTRALATGGAGFALVSGLDVETMVDKVSFSVANSPTGQEQAGDWKQRTIDHVYNTVKASWPGQETIQVFKYCRMENSPEAEHSADGNIDIEFAGKRSGD
jgi:hypothetical protein